jgi:hypothetical protein
VTAESSVRCGDTIRNPLCQALPCTIKVCGRRLLSAPVLLAAASRTRPEEFRLPRARDREPSRAFAQFHVPSIPRPRLGRVTYGAVSRELPELARNCVWCSQIQGYDHVLGYSYRLSWEPRHRSSRGQDSIRDDSEAASPWGAHGHVASIRHARGRFGLARIRSRYRPKGASVAHGSESLSHRRAAGFGSASVLEAAGRASRRRRRGRGRCRRRTARPPRRRGSQCAWSLRSRVHVAIAGERTRVNIEAR